MLAKYKYIVQIKKRMKNLFLLLVALLLASVSIAKENCLDQICQTEKSEDAINPWCGCYCFNFFNGTRTARILPKGKFTLSLKFQDFDFDEKEYSQGKYKDIGSGQRKYREKYILTSRYGWAEGHHFAVSVPYIRNDFNFGKVKNNSEDIGNIALIEKFEIFKETNTRPAVSFDFSYFLPTGDSNRKVGTDNESYRMTFSVSKAWKDFSLHLNPSYRWNKDQGRSEESRINAAILLTPGKTFKPALEYNYRYLEGSGHSQDIVPGVLWNFCKGMTMQVGIPINLDSTFKHRDEVGLIMKICKTF